MNEDTTDIRVRITLSQDENPFILTKSYTNNGRRTLLQLFTDDGIQPLSITVIRVTKTVVKHTIGELKLRAFINSHDCLLCRNRLWVVVSAAAAKSRVQGFLCDECVETYIDKEIAAGRTVTCDGSRMFIEVAKEYYVDRYMRCKKYHKDDPHLVPAAVTYVGGVSHEGSS